MVFIFIHRKCYKSVKKAHKFYKNFYIYSMKTQKRTRKITLSRLQNIAGAYLERYGGTEKSVRQMLGRRIEKSCASHPDQDMVHIAMWVDTVIARLQSYGYINDTQYATARVKKLFAKGKSTSYIYADLHAKGVARDIVDTVVQSAAQTHTHFNMQSVHIFVQKKRLGIYRYSHTDDIQLYLENYDTFGTQYNQYYKKDLARCARQGFGYDISVRALLGRDT